VALFGIAGLKMFFNWKTITLL